MITEESGIAKGIRRIVAVTGHEAAEVTRQAQEFEDRLKVIETLDGKAKDAALKTLTVELGQSDISVLKKADLKDKAGAIRKALDKQIKEKEAAANKKALEDFGNYFKDNADALAYVAVVDVDGNAKVRSPKRVQVLSLTLRVSLSKESPRLQGRLARPSTSSATSLASRRLLTSTLCRPISRPRASMRGSGLPRSLISSLGRPEERRTVPRVLVRRRTRLRRPSLLLVNILNRLHKLLYSSLLDVCTCFRNA